MHYNTPFCQKGQLAFLIPLLESRCFPAFSMMPSLRSGLLLASLLIPTSLFAQSTPSFTDLKTDHPAFAAVEYLKAQGILSGYSDGTFRPNQAVTRAEAVKIIVAPLVSAVELAGYTTTPFNDIPAGTWYLPFTQAALKLKAIDGPPAKPGFKGANNVTLAEFLKIMETANGINPATAYSEITSPLSVDVANSSDWYYAPMRYAITSSMVIVNADGTLLPGKTLNRGDVATLMYRYMMYKEGRRTQALLSEVEGEIVNVLQLLETKDILQADLASTRALLAARGALASRPDEPIVKGAMKTAEGFRSLVSAFIAGSTNQYQQAVDLAGAAWNLANKAREFSPNLDSLASQMQVIAKSMADEARKNLQ